MGNKVTQSAVTGIFQDLEQITGKRLIAAIREDDDIAVMAALEIAKSECSKPICSHNNNATYNDMATIIVDYLTQPYDVGDGPLFKQTPLKYCKLLKAKKAEQCLIKCINDAQQKTRAKDSATVGTVTADRAALAKERLKAFRDAK